jgi:glycosyltransferase involved in cell wall biosynthesis
VSLRIAVLSSTPPSPTEGSGTFVALDGLVRGLSALGHRVDFRPLRRRSGFHTFDRWLYNATVSADPPRADLVLGVDLDGFLWARRRRGGARTYVVALKGIIADELRNERGIVRALLGIQARWERRNTERADRVIVPSRYSAAIAATLYDVPDARLAVVPEPIDLAEWRRRFDAAGAPRDAGRPTVLTVARLYPRKRVEDVLEAAALLRTRIADLQVRIVGEGPEGSRLRAAHARLGLGDTVVFLGHVTRDALALEYSRARCFCLPTVQEGFGLVFAEAMAAGLPVVACRAAAVPELVHDGETGLLVPPRTPAALAAALERVLGDDRLRKEMGMAGRARVETLDLVPVARRFLEAVS